MLVVIYCSVGRDSNERRLLNSFNNKKSIYSTKLLASLNNIHMPTVKRYNTLWEDVNIKLSPDIVMFGADDIEFVTPNFDRIITNYFDNHIDIDILYPDDGIHGENLPTHPIFRNSFLNKIGEMFPVGYMRHLFVDNYVLELGKKLNNIAYLPEVKLVHHHPLVNKGRWDKYTLNAYSRDRKETDKKMYEKCILEHLPKITKIINN